MEQERTGAAERLQGRKDGTVGNRNAAPAAARWWLRGITVYDPQLQCFVREAGWWGRGRAVEWERRRGGGTPALPG